MAEKDIELRDNGAAERDIKMTNDAGGEPPPAAPRRRAMLVT